MCFVKSPKISKATTAEMKSVAQEPVERKEADAASTKTNQIEVDRNTGYKQNIKTSALGLEDEAQVGKKTLLGE